MQGDVRLADSVVQQFVDHLRAVLQFLRAEPVPEPIAPSLDGRRLRPGQHRLDDVALGQYRLKVARCERARQVDQVGGEQSRLASVMVEMHKPMTSQ
jgi:hypothetical protein